MTNNDFQSPWIRRSSDAGAKPPRAKAPDANDILRAGGPGALRRALDEARVVPLIDLPANEWSRLADEPRRAPAQAARPPNDRPAAWQQEAITAEKLQHEVFAPIAFLVPDLIPAEGVTLICSKPKLGKSWLVLDLCLGCTTDRFILGELKPVQGDVLYLALEDSRRRLQRRLTKLLPSFAGEWPKGLTLVTSWRRVNEGGLDDIRAWHKAAGKPVLVVVDVLVKVRPVTKGSRSAYELDYEALGGLQKLAAELGVAVIVVHHTRKMAAEDLLDTVSGSFGLVGAADTVIVLERRGAAAVLDVRGRDIEQAELAIAFNKATCRWTILGAAAEVHRSEERSRVLTALAEADEPLGPKEIMAALGRNDRNAVDALLFRMAADGDIDKVGRGKYAIPA
ncbi:MAG: AAA family ATPase [Xanthobacteraceae bacterium]